MAKTFRKRKLMTLFFLYCGFGKVSDIRQLSDGNHKLLKGYQTVIVRLSDGHHF